VALALRLSVSLHSALVAITYFTDRAALRLGRESGPRFSKWRFHAERMSFSLTADIKSDYDVSSNPPVVVRHFHYYFGRGSVCGSVVTDV